MADYTEPATGEKGWGGTFLFLGMLTFLVAAFLFITRRMWLPTWRNIIARFGRDTNYSFLSDQEAGLSSNTFDLSGNIASSDSRQGLDVNAKNKIKQLMRQEGLTFDQARERYTKSEFQRNEIGPDGRPMDPKAVFFS